MEGAQSVRVLVVGANAAAIRDRLRAAPTDFSLSVAADREAALDRIAAGAVDGVVCSYDMAGDDGIDFLRAIRERRAEVPFVLYAADGSEAVATEALRAGVTDYVPAPVTADALGERVLDAVGGDADATVRANASLLGETLVGVYLIQDGRFRYVNDYICSTFGYDRETLLEELTPFDVVTDADHETLARNLARRERGEVSHLQYSLTGVRADGSHIDLVVHGHRVIHRGEPAVLGTLLDVTEQARLSSERDLLSTLLHDVPTASDFEGALISTLRAVCAVTDWEYGEVWVPDEAGARLSRHVGWTGEADLAGFVETSEATTFERGEGLPGRVFASGAVEWLDDASAVGSDTFQRREAAAGAGLHTAVGVPATADGEVVAVLVFMTRETRSRDDRLLDLVSLVGSQAGALLASRRATDRLDRERSLLDRLFETSPVGIVVLCPDGNVQRANGHAETVLGLTEGELSGRAYDAPEWEILDAAGDPIDSAALPFARVLETGEPVVGYEHGIAGPSGSRTWLSVNAAPVRVDGALACVVATVEDITERRRREADLRAEKERLAEFASIVSHDLRNPLGVAKGYADLLRETGDMAHLDPIDRAHERMGTLIEDLLALARFGRTETPLAPVSLASVARDAWEIAGREPATMTVASDRRLLADRNRLQQLFENLFRNCVEHAGPEVAVEVGALSDGFYVADDGPGVPEGVRDRLFERGASGDGGTGLGLYVVKHIAGGHDWSVELAAGDGGARFEIRGVESPEEGATGVDTDDGTGGAADSDGESAADSDDERDGVTGDDRAGTPDATGENGSTQDTPPNE